MVGSNGQGKSNAIPATASHRRNRGFYIVRVYSRPRGQSLISVRNPYYFGSSLHPSIPSDRHRKRPPRLSYFAATPLRPTAAAASSDSGQTIYQSHQRVSAETGGSRVNINLSPFKPIRIHVSGQTLLFIRCMLCLMCTYVRFFPLVHEAGVVFAFVPDHKFAEIAGNTCVRACVPSSSAGFLWKHAK